MTYINRHIIETYSDLFEGLSSDTKIELIETLSKSLKSNRRKRELDFYKSFGSFASKKSPEEIALEIRKARKFRKKDIKI